MKVNLQFLACAGILSGGLAFGEAASAEGTVKKKEIRPHVQVAVEFIETPVAEANRIIATKGLTLDGEKLRAELQVLVDRDKATALDTTLVSAASGQKGAVESVREIIYPTEREPDGFSPETPAQAAARLRRALASLPEEFATRKTGNTLEIEPVFGDHSRLVEIRLFPEWVHHTGDRQWAMGNEPAIQQPYFYSLRTVSTVTCTDGVPQLLTVLKPASPSGPPDDSRKLFVIVTASIISPTAP